MKITILCVGKLKEPYWSGAVAEYAKRLGKYHRLDIIELADEKAPENLSPAQMEQIKTREGQRILKHIKGDEFVVTLEVLGRQLTSEELSALIEDKAVAGVSHIVFIIGGSLGLSDEVINASGYHLSFSKMTFPHQLMRVILLEQIYRSAKISRNEPYHK